MPIKHGKRGRRKKSGNVTRNYGADGALKSITYKSKGSKSSTNTSLVDGGFRTTTSHGMGYYTKVGGVTKDRKKSDRTAGCVVPFIAIVCGARHSLAVWAGCASDSEQPRPAPNVHKPIPLSTLLLTCPLIVH